RHPRSATTCGHRSQATRDRSVRRIALLPFAAQGRQQPDQVVVVELVHQRQQLTELPGRKTLPREPREVVPRQVGDDPPLVFAKGHLTGEQQLKLFGIHLSSPCWHISPRAHLPPHPICANACNEALAARLLKVTTMTEHT